MKQLVVSVTNDLTTDQRVHKICTTLSKEGYRILLIGRELKTSVPITRAYKTARMTLLFKKGFLFYAEYNIRLFFKLLFIKKDILLANDLDTLLANYLIHKIFKTKLVYDSHELFTEVPELVNRPRVQNFWLQIEKYILPKLKNAYTVSPSIASHYNKIYKTDFKIVMNTPAKRNVTPISFPFEVKNNKIIIYQGALNKGRGLELIIETMQYLKGVLFVIIGGGDIVENLREKVRLLDLESKIKFLGKKTPTELQNLTPLADIGISLEEDLGLNYKYALPNKIFDYIHAKVPILISNLPEMSKITKRHTIGKTVTTRDPYKLAKLIEDIFDNQEQYNTWCKNLEKAAEEYTWEKESKKLKKIYANLQ